MSANKSESCRFMLNRSEFRFAQSDIVNPDDWEPKQSGKEYGRRNRGYLIHEYGCTIAVVFAHGEQDALDIAADEGKLDTFRIEEGEYADYGIDGDDPTADFLGNDGMPYDIKNIGIVELPDIALNYAVLFNAEMSRKRTNSCLKGYLGLSDDCPDTVLRDKLMESGVPDDIATIIVRGQS